MYMYIPLYVLVASVLPFGITAERYLVSCGNGEMEHCSPSLLAALEDHGATVIDNFPFGVAVIEADENLDSVVSGVTITLDLMVQLETTDDIEAVLSDSALLYQASGSTSKDGEGGGRRLQMKPPPTSDVNGK
jgi:hypothetical protein